MQAEALDKPAKPCAPLHVADVARCRTWWAAKLEGTAFMQICSVSKRI